MKNKTHLRLQGRGRADCTTVDNTPNHCNITAIHHHPVFQEKYIHPEKIEQKDQEGKVALAQRVFQTPSSNINEAHSYRHEHMQTYSFCLLLSWWFISLCIITDNVSYSIYFIRAESPIYKSAFISTCTPCEPVCAQEQRLHDLQCKTEESL